MFVSSHTHTFCLAHPRSLSFTLSHILTVIYGARVRCLAGAVFGSLSLVVATTC